MQLTRRQFLRALALLPALALPDLVRAQGPGGKVYLPLVGGDGNVTVPDGCSTDPILALVCANGDRLDLLTWEAGFELDDPGWRPQVAQFKGGGSYSNSQIAEGQTLVAGEYDNVVETIPLIGRGTDEAKCIQTYRRLQQFIKRAADYWKEPSEYDCVWLEARPGGEGCRTGYARVIKAACADFSNPFGQPFFSQQTLSVADGLSLVVEREPLWRAVPPGEMVGPLYNLLKNPDFEDWNSGVADSQPDCWDDLETFWITGDNSRDSDPKWGRYCLKVHSGNSVQANGAKGVTQTVEGIEDGQEYTVVAWIRNGGVLQGVGRLLVTSLLGQYEVYRESTRHGWELHTFTFTAGVGDVIGVNCEILSTAAGCDGEVFFDSLMLLKGDWEDYALDGLLPYMTSSHIYNHWDQPGETVVEAGRVNYVDVWEVPGDVDSLLRLEVLNETVPADNSNIVESYGQIYVGQRRTGDVQNFSNYFDPVGVVDPTASGGDYISGTVNTAWLDFYSAKLMGGSVTRNNEGRFRVLARLYDGLGAGSPTLQARLSYYLGAPIARKILQHVDIGLRAAWVDLNLTPTAAMIVESKWAADPLGAIGFTLQLRRSSGSAAARLDYIHLLPTDGGFLSAQFDPPVSPQSAMIVDNTSSQMVSFSGVTRLFVTVSSIAGADNTEDLKYFNGYIYAATYAGVFRTKLGENTWTRILNLSRCRGLEIYNGNLYVSRYNGATTLTELYLTSDGVTFSLATTLAGELGQIVYALRSFNGYLWLGLNGNGNIYSWDGSAPVLEHSAASGVYNLEVYANKLYYNDGSNLGNYDPSTGVWNDTVAALLAVPFSNSLKTWKGKIWIAQGVGDNQVLQSWDESTLATVLNLGLAGGQFQGIDVLDDVLYVGLSNMFPASLSTLYYSSDGVTWSQIPGLADVGYIQSLTAMEGNIYVGGGAAGEGGTTWIYKIVPSTSVQYAIANYQGKPFTAPNRRLRDDERRHRWVFSYDRSDGSNVIGDKALVGIGYVPRYLGLLGEG